MHGKNIEKPKRRDRFRRLAIDYADAQFHQNEEIIKLLKEVRDLLKKDLQK